MTLGETEVVVTSRALSSQPHLHYFSLDRSIPPCSPCLPRSSGVCSPLSFLKGGWGQQCSQARHMMLDTDLHLCAMVPHHSDTSPYIPSAWPPSWSWGSNKSGGDWGSRGSLTAPKAVVPCKGLGHLHITPVQEETQRPSVSPVWGKGMNGKEATAIVRAREQGTQCVGRDGREV